jgi:hypothetical protein
VNIDRRQQETREWNTEARESRRNFEKSARVSKQSRSQTLAHVERKLAQLGKVQRKGGRFDVPKKLRQRELMKEKINNLKLVPAARKHELVRIGQQRKGRLDGREQRFDVFLKNFFLNRRLVKANIVTKCKTKFVIDYFDIAIGARTAVKWNQNIVNKV